MLKGIIFDADGTLLDSMPIWSNLGARYLTAKGIQPESNLNQILFSMTIEEACGYLKSHYSLLDSTEEIAEDILKDISDFYLYQVILKKGAKEFLLQMQKDNIPMLIATSGDKELITSALQRLGVIDCFMDIISCSDLQISKKQADIYLHCAKKIGAKPEEIVVFEDALHAVQSAKKARFITCAIEDSASIEDREALKAFADYYISDFVQLDLSNL